MSGLTHDASVKAFIEHPNYQWYVVCDICGIVSGPWEDSDEAQRIASGHAAAVNS